MVSDFVFRVSPCIHCLIPTNSNSTTTSNTPIERRSQTPSIHTHHTPNTPKHTTLPTTPITTTQQYGRLRILILTHNIQPNRQTPADRIRPERRGQRPDIPRNLRQGRSRHYNRQEAG